MGKKATDVLKAVLNNHEGKAIDVAAGGGIVRVPNAVFQRPDGGLVEVKDFSGKHLRISKSIIRGGLQQTLPAGIAWEDISNDLKFAIHFNDGDFK